MAAVEAEAQLNTIFRKFTDQLRAPSKDLHGLHAVNLELIEHMEWVTFRDAWMGLDRRAVSEPGRKQMADAIDFGTRSKIEAEV